MSIFDLSISPSQIEYIVQPGNTIIQAYQIKNNSGNPMYLSTSVETWKPKNTDGSVDYDNSIPSPYFDFSFTNSDIKLGETFTLQPNTEKQLVLKIHSTSTAPTDDVYATFFITQDPGQIPGESQTSAIVKVGSHLLLTTNTTDNPEFKAEIIDFKASPTFKDIILNKITFSAQAKNQGDFYFKTNGSLSIAKNNLEIKKINLTPLNVLSHTNRQIQCTYQSATDSATSSDCTLSPPFWPGKYQATLTLTQNDKNISQSISFFVFPYTLILITIFISALIFSLYLLKFKKNH